MDIDGEEEHGRAIGVHIAQQPAPVHIAHDMFDAVERHRLVRHIMHCQNDARHHLDGEEKGQNTAERPQIIQIARGWIDLELVMHHAHDRQPDIEPFGDGPGRLIA